MKFTTEKLVNMLVNNDPKLEEITIHNIDEIDFDILYESTKKYTNSSIYWMYGYLHILGYAKFKKNYEIALTYFALSIDQGSTRALSAISMIYDKKKNYEKTFNYNKLASDRGNSFGHSNLGYIYMNEFWPEKNYETAKFYFKLAIKKNNDNAFAHIGIGELYCQVIQNYKKALHHYSLSKCEIGHFYISRMLKKWTDIDEYLIILIKKNKDLEKKIKESQERNIEFRYRPGNIGYIKSLIHFESILNQKI